MKKFIHRVITITPAWKEDQYTANTSIRLIASLREDYGAENVPYSGQEVILDSPKPVGERIYILSDGLTDIEPLLSHCDESLVFLIYAVPHRLFNLCENINTVAMADFRIAGPTNKDLKILRHDPIYGDDIPSLQQPLVIPEGSSLDSEDKDVWLLPICGATTGELDTVGRSDVMAGCITKIHSRQHPHLPYRDLARSLSPKAVQWLKLLSVTNVRFPDFNTMYNKVTAITWISTINPTSANLGIKELLLHGALTIDKDGVGVREDLRDCGEYSLPPEQVLALRGITNDWES